MMTEANTNARVRSLAADDISRLETVLTDAFRNDPGLRYVIPDDREWTRIAPRYFRTVLVSTLKRGHGLAEGARRGVSVWEPPGYRNSLPSQVLNLVRTALLFRGNLERAMRAQTHTERYRPRRAHWYLAYIATDPKHQRSGIGGALLEPLLDLAARQRTPVYLECSNESNLGFYLARGFSLVDEIILPGGPRVWPMLREAR